MLLTIVGYVEKSKILLSFIYKSQNNYSGHSYSLGDIKTIRNILLITEILFCYCEILNLKKCSNTSCRLYRKL